MRNVFSFAIAIIVCLSTGYAEDQAPQPNFVLIFADDLGYGDVGYQGGDVPTPHIDSIAANGVICTDGYVTCPVCAPSRAGLLTGRYQQSFGFWDNIGPYRAGPDVNPGIPADLPILSERLQALGYTTGIFGKTHDGVTEEQMAFSRWDEFYGFNNGASNYLGGMNRAHNPIFHNREIVGRSYASQGIGHDEVISDGALQQDLDQHLTDVLGDRAADFIGANKDQPFLCYVPFNAVHGPFQAPQPLVEKYAHITDRKRQLVAAMLDSMDENIGKILTALREHGLEERTMVVFLSDNGGHEASPNEPLRGKKATYWEGGLRVPFCAQWLGEIPAGSRFAHPVSSLDILPTFVTAAGGEIQADWQLDGVDILGHLTGEDSTRPHQTLYWTWGPRKAIRHHDLKALSQDNGKSWQLYQLANDIGETTDLAQKRPKKLSELIEKHAVWESSLMPPQWGWNKALGYEDPNFGKPQPYHTQK